MTSVASEVEQRHIGLRIGELRHDVVAPDAMTLSELLQNSATALRSSQRLVRERSGEFLDPRSRLSDLDDGEVVAIVETHAPARQRQRRRGTPKVTRNQALSAWWLMGLAGVIAGTIFALVPQTLPDGWQRDSFCVLVVAAVVAAILFVRRQTTDKTAHGTMMLGPAGLVAAAAVVISPPGTFSLSVTIITIAAMTATLFFVTAVVARRSVETAQLNSLGAVMVGVAVVYSAVLVMNLRDLVAAAIIVGAAPAVLRILPTTMMHVPPAIFIDFAEHQQSRFSVREVIPDPITKINRDRVENLVARSTARMRIVTFSVCISVVVSAPAVVFGLTEVPLVEMIGRLVLAACVVVMLALTARRFSARSLKFALRSASLAVLVMTLLAVLANAPEVARSTVAIAALVLCLVVGASVVVLGRGARSVYWSRFGDIVEGITLVFSLPAAFVGAGIIGAVQGAMN